MLVRKIINELLGMKAIIASSRPKIESLMYVVKSLPRVLMRTGNINYLGGSFYYTDRNAPFLLQWYPEEIEAIVKKTGKINTCLDIGANIGQFAYTLKKYMPNMEIVAVEPQKEAIESLIKN